MSGAAATAWELPEPAGAGRVFEAVLAGVVLHGTAARLAAMIDASFLAGAGWDPVSRALSFPAGHRLLGRQACRVSGCGSAAHRQCCGVCWRCLTWLRGLGMTVEQISAGDRQLPPRPAGEELLCAVPGCCRETPGHRRESVSAQAVLCRAHRSQFTRKRSRTLGEFLAGPGVRPLGSYETCAVTSCSRLADCHLGYCNAHYARWRKARSAAPRLDARAWEQAEPPVAASGQVSLRRLPPLVAVQVLFGLWRRTTDGAKTAETTLRVACRALAGQQAATIGDCDISRVPGENARALIRVLARHVRLAVTGPDSEQARDLWDLGVFGHRGRIDFTGITQPWLRECAKRWAAQDLPRHRGRGSCEVRNAVNAVARLSETLSLRPGRGDRPGELTRRDIEGFLNRLGYLESAGTISRYRRNAICRGARTVLGGIRVLGLDRPGQPAAGLPADVVISVADIPARAEPGEPGRDLPAEIMQVLCAALGDLEPGEFRAAAQVAIDTGRRPEEIVSLPLDCLTRDRDGKAVLVYDNRKAARDRRRLPVSEDTAAVITAQQARVTAWFAGTPPGELALLPTPLRNPAGRRPASVSWFENRHREWAGRLGPLTTRDGTPFDPARIVPYAYRHTYAQRHADAGVPIDVLAQLMDHKNLDQTRGYYRVGEDRRRAAVDKVTAMSFDRHGNPLWRDARALLDAEHARYAIGQVAVPYGTCTEPSNVAAGGGACPVRFRCAGCDHFRTDVSYLPDLTAHLDDLLRTRERLAAMAGVDEWARAAAAPPQEEITRIRHLITQINGDVAQLSDHERAVIGDAVSTIRKHRAVCLGMPAIRVRTAATAQERTA
ncbi:MAG: tyrosine-type recombinase/integrase [Streptosporangiales bacterium]